MMFGIGSTRGIHKINEFMFRKVLLLAILGFLVIGIVLFMDFYDYTHKSVAIGDDTFAYEVQPGTTFQQLANDLHARGVISKPFYWAALARLQNKAHKIKAGLYRFEESLTPVDLLDRFVGGKTVQFSLTIPEGWTYKQLLEAINTHPQITPTLTDGAKVMEQLGRADEHPEGWFYPDTYQFPKGTTDIDFLSRSHKIMETRLHEEWESRSEGLPLKTPYEALTLASIVEKETGVSEERSLIAAVFISRLKKGMPLQTDPTVIYGLGDDYDGNIRYRDLRRDTPYNTYLHKGLPPTPIAMPGGDALRAVLHPANTRALYFVAKGDGSHQFSETYAEHRKAVIAYQLKGDKRRYRARK